MEIKNVITGVKKTMVKRSPEILTGLGIAGMFTTVVLAVKATPKAIQIIQEKEVEYERKLTKTEVVQVSWKYYIPTAASFTLSAVCLIGANSVNAKRSTALAAAYKLSESALREYKHAVVETIGEVKEKEVRDKMHEEKLKKEPSTNTEVIITGTGEVLCYDAISSRYFKSSVEDIRRAENVINKSMIDCMYASLSELYNELGLNHTSISDDLGWNLDDGLVEIYLGSHISDDGKPCVVMDFENPPTYGFDKLVR